MSFTLTAVKTQINAMIQADDNEIGPFDRERGIYAALERFSRDAPDEVTEDVSGDGGKYYAISGLTYFAEEYSRITKIEYPAYAVSSDETPQFLDAEDWDDNYRDGSNVRYLFLPNHAPAATETMRITYTAPYTVVSDAISIPSQNYYAFCNLVACEVCRYIATKYARTSDNSISADSVDHSGRSGRFRDMASDFCAAYERMMGFATDDGTSTGAAGEFVDWDTAPGWPTSRRWMFDRG